MGFMDFFNFIRGITELGKYGVERYDEKQKKKEERIKHLKELRRELGLVLTERRSLIQGLTTAVDVLYECDTEGARRLIDVIQREQRGHENITSVQAVASLVPIRAQGVQVHIAPEELRDPTTRRVSAIPDYTPVPMFQGVLLSGVAYLQSWLNEREEILVHLFGREIAPIDEDGQRTVRLVEQRSIERGILNEAPMVFVRRDDIQAVVNDALNLVRRAQDELQRNIDHER